MAKKKKLEPTQAELEILQFLWDEGPATVKEVHQHLADIRDKDIVYTTTLKTMQVMYERGFLHREAAGRKHIYNAAIEEQATKKQLLDKFLHFTFGGSALSLVMKVLGDYKTSPKELQELKNYIESIEKKDNS
ncbi:MAG: BlaI/MecI/CopY family transcriptional regulator [Bacteroidota bacterium]